MDLLIKEIYHLWKPVLPFLVRQIKELYGRRDGDVLEMGPFSGLIFDFYQNHIGENFSMALFPEAAISLFQQEVQAHGLKDRIRIIQSDSSLTGIADHSFDLVIFRGALFFPSLFQVDLGAIDRILTKKGMAFVGGGFGKYTPPELIHQIRIRSDQLNAAMGRVRMTLENVKDQIRANHLEEKCEVSTDGGLWIVMKK